MRHTPAQWAAFSWRYITAWANWKVAYRSWRVHHHTNGDDAPPFVWGWGGGVAFAETGLARLEGCRAALISSNDARLRLISETGIQPIDRRDFRRLDFDDDRYRADASFRKSYQEAEGAFLEVVREKTRGLGVSIFIDYIGLPVVRATLKALRRPGVITTAGWKQGMNLSILRAIECMNWHVHVHTHYARYEEAGRPWPSPSATAGRAAGRRPAVRLGRDTPAGPRLRLGGTAVPTSRSSKSTRCRPAQKGAGRPLPAAN